MDELDLGNGYSLQYTRWAPDREINPQYDGIPDCDRIGAILTCKHGKEGALHFDHGPLYETVFKTTPKWQVQSWEPLTISPSIDSGCCHGFIREGKWVDA